MGESGELCPECGQAHQGQECEHRGSDSGKLRVLPGLGHEDRATDDTGHDRVRVVREFKGTTVDDLVEGSHSDRLPGQVRPVLKAIEAGDLEAANRRLDVAMGSLLRGPGYARRDELLVVLPVLLSLLLSLVAATLLIFL